MIVNAPQSHWPSLPIMRGKRPSSATQKLGDFLTSFANTLGTSPTGFLAPLILDAANQYHKKTAKCSKHLRQTSMRLTECLNDHPLRDLLDPTITTLNVNMIPRVSSNHELTSFPNQDASKISTASNWAQTPIGEPEITIPLTVYRLEHKPLISESPPRFGRGNAAFLRKFVAEKRLLENGKITGITCRPRVRPVRSQSVHKRMGIVIAWPKVRKGRTWTAISSFDI